MAGKSSSISELNKLHRLVAESLNSRLKQDLEDNIPTDAATIGAAITFLKNNSITADPTEKEDLNNLRHSLTDLAKKRKEKANNVIALAKTDLSSEDYTAMQG